MDGRPRSFPLSRVTPLFIALAMLSQTVAARGDGDCQTRTPPPTLFRADSGSIPAPVQGQIATISFSDLPAFRGWVAPAVRFEASADLGLKTELLQVRVNGGSWQSVGFAYEADCANPPNCSNGSPWIPLDGIGPLLTVEVRASAAVDAASCPDGFIRLRIQYLADGNPDCNGNGIADACEIEAGTLADCDSDGRPDACQLEADPDSDCDGNGLPDCCDFRNGRHDCDRNGRLDDCDIALDASLDCNANGLLDGCEISSCLVTDADRNRRPDSCDVADGTLADCDGNGIADIVELMEPGNDLDGDLVLDACDPRSADIFANGAVGPEDLAILLGAWATGSGPADLNRDLVVNAADLTVLLSQWGPVGFCGDGLLSPNENCCNCPEDAWCEPGFDCFYGSCVACPSGLCPPWPDACYLLYGPAPGYGMKCCWSEGNSPCPGNPDGTDCGCSGHTGGYGYGYGYGSGCGYGCGYGYEWSGYTPCNRPQSSVLICGVPVLGGNRGGNFAMTAVTVDWPAAGTLGASLGFLGLLGLSPGRLFRRNTPGR